jgi:hypothetical protein
LEHFPGGEVREQLLGLGRIESDSLRGTIEKEVARLIEKHAGQKVDPRLVIAHAFRYVSLRMAPQDDESSIVVARPSEHKTFEEESSLFASLKEGYTRADIEVYAPVDWPTRTDRLRMRDALHEPIKSTIVEICEQVKEEP